MTSITSRLIIQAIRRAYVTDQSNRYRLNHPWILPRLAEPVPRPYTSSLLMIEGHTVTILPYDDCDGASLAPDRIGDWSFVEAAIAHDAIYKELEAIAAAWDWTVDQVRAWADAIFLGIAVHHAPSRLARLYWRGVRAAGGVWHSLRNALAGILLLSCIAGCAGCSTPVDPFDPSSPYIPPDFSKIAAGPVILSTPCR